MSEIVLSLSCNVCYEKEKTLSLYFHHFLYNSKLKIKPLLYDILGTLKTDIENPIQLLFA